MLWLRLFQQGLDKFREVLEGRFALESAIDDFQPRARQNNLNVAFAGAARDA
jgi:hypothetical protein